MNEVNHIPANAAATPMMIELITYNAACILRCSLISCIVSYPKVENVVYAPQNPMPSTAHHNGSNMPSPVSTYSIPSSKDPLILITQVPQGNDDPAAAALRDMIFPSPYLSIAPAIPPTPAAQIILCSPSVLPVLTSIGPIGSQDNS